MARTPNDAADMYSLYDSNDIDDNQAHHDYETNQTPTDTDPTRPPQLNLGNTSCRCNCGCLCSSSDDDGDGSAAQVKAAALNMHEMCVNDSNGGHYASSDPGDNPINGQEGDEHMIEAGDLGPISSRIVIRALARHRCGCTCRARTVTDVGREPYITYHTPIDSGMMSPSSNVADASSPSPSDHNMSSMTSSVLSLPSRGSSITSGVGEMFMHDAILDRLPVLYQPLRLTPEYPMTLDITASELESGIRMEEDLW